MIKVRSTIALCAVSAVLALCPFSGQAAEVQTAAVINMPVYTRRVQTSIGASINHNKASEAAAETDLQPGMPSELIPLGMPIGIKLYSEGIIISGFSDVDTDNGKFSPAQRAGIKKGDVILKANGENITTTEQFEQATAQSAGDAITFEIRRGQKDIILMVNPEKSAADGKYRIGAWVRDSMAGIGTVSFVDPRTGIFGALGHSVNDSDSGQIIPMRKGSVMSAQIKGVKKGVSGIPGALEGLFDLSRDIGTLYSNTASGIFGRMTDKTVYEGKNAMPVASRDEVKTGKAYAICTVSGGEAKQYEIEIEKIYSVNAGEKNMLIRVTDSELIGKTGGIVQGMSGSPIIQNGKVIGAVTHVLINNPEKGYGIFVENMLNNVYEQQTAKIAA